MVEQQAHGLVGEYYWPDVSEQAMRAVDERIARCAESLNVRYLGSILLQGDEVVLCQFEGTTDAVRQVGECAEVAFDRILESTTYRAQGGNTP